MGKQAEKQKLEAFGRTLERMLKSEEERLPDWLERKDCVRATIRLTEKDHATILALPVAVVEGLIERLVRLVEGAVDLETLSVQTPGEMWELVKSILADERIGEALEIVDEVLARSIQSWELGEIGQAYGHDFNVELGRAGYEIRAAIWRALPLSALRRLVEGVVLHSGNS